MTGDLAWNDYDDTQLQRTGVYTLPDGVQHRVTVGYVKFEREGQRHCWSWQLDNEPDLVAPLSGATGTSNNAKNALKAAIEVCDKSYTARDAAREQLQDLDDYD